MKKTWLQFNFLMSLISHITKSLFVIVMIIIISIFTISCSKPLDNPEIIDPIYNDLIGQQKANERSIKDMKDQLNQAKEDVKKTKPQTGDYKRMIKIYYDKKHNLESLEQQAHYLELRIQKRIYLDRLNYQEAFNKKEPWPNKEEFKRYSDQQRLKNASPIWDQRVPKLNERYQKKSQTISIKKNKTEKENPNKETKQ